MTIYDITPVVAEATNTEIFSCAEFGDLTVLEIDNEPWFVGKEVAEKLGYSNDRDAIARHVDEEDLKILEYKACRETRHSTLWKGSDYSNKKLINESGLYSLVLSSKLEGAKRFKRWVTKDILPAIRKTGGYIPHNQNMSEAEIMAAAMQIANKTIEEQRKRIDMVEKEKENLSNVIAGVAPTVEFAETILESNRTLTATQIGADYGISAIELNSILHEKGIQYKNNGQWILYAKYKDRGYVESKTFYIGNGDTRTRTVWTQKGRKFIHEILTEMGYKNKQLEMEV